GRPARWRRWLLPEFAIVAAPAVWQWAPRRLRGFLVRRATQLIRVIRVGFRLVPGGGSTWLKEPWRGSTRTRGSGSSAPEAAPRTFSSTTRRSTRAATARWMRTRKSNTPSGRGPRARRPHRSAPSDHIPRQSRVLGAGLPRNSFRRRRSPAWPPLLASAL